MQRHCGVHSGIFPLKENTTLLGSLSSCSLRAPLRNRQPTIALRCALTLALEPWVTGPVQGDTQAGGYPITQDFWPLSPAEKWELCGIPVEGDLNSKLHLLLKRLHAFLYPEDNGCYKICFHQENFRCRNHPVPAPLLMRGQNPSIWMRGDPAQLHSPGCTHLARSVSPWGGNPLEHLPDRSPSLLRIFPACVIVLLKSAFNRCGCGWPRDSQGNGKSVQLTKACNGLR